MAIQSRILFLFNFITLGLGIYAIYDLIKNNHKYIVSFILILITVVSLIFTYNNITQTISPIYIPSDDFNQIYKLPQSQVEVLEKTREIIKIEQIDTPRVISQIYGTLAFLEKIDLLAFRVDQRRSLYSIEYYFDDFLQLFYTPVFQGDDGYHFDAPVNKTCELLMANQVDFVIYDKNLSVYDKDAGNWIPTYWYARNCYTKTYENDRYILYRFFWD